MRLFSNSTITEKIALALTVVILLMPAAASGELNQGVAGTTLGVLFPGSSFDPAIPTQAEVTGVEPGARPLRPDEVLAFSGPWPRPRRGPG